MFVFSFSDAFRGGLHRGGPSPYAPQRGSKLRRQNERTPLLPISPHCGLRGVRLGLHHRSETVRRALLFRRVSIRDVTEVRPHASHEDRLTQQRPAVLRAAQNERHLHALLRPESQRRVRQPAGDGGGPMRLLVIPLNCFLFIRWTLHSDALNSVL